MTVPPERTIPTTPTLRPYQSAVIADLRASLRSHRRVLVQLPTGGGKTVIAATVASGAHAKGRRAVFLCHRAELLRQASETFDRFGIPHGLIQAGAPLTDAAIQVASIQTLARRLGQMPPPDLVFADEAHHSVAGTWVKLLAAWPEARIVGLTATPERLDGRGLSDVFDAMVSGPSVVELMGGGYLSGYKAFAPSTVDLSGVRTRMGEYAAADLSAAVDKPALVGDIVSTYRKLAMGKRAILFAASIGHSKHLVEAFQSAGIAARHVDGSTPADERAQAIADFAAGRTLVLSNVELFGEGFDVPAVEVVILARPTQSLSLHLQQIGRALRPAEGKPHALILDHAGNLARHGLPDDDREWSLDGLARGRKRGAEALPAVKVCPDCFCTHRPAAACPECGHQYAPMVRKLEEREGELQEVNAATLNRAKQGKCQSLDDLVAYGKSKNMKNPIGWARHVMAGRQKRSAA